MNLIRLGDLTINPHISMVMIGSKEVLLEPKLFELLMLFCENSDQIITREQILDAIWENSIITDNAVNKLIANLRKALQDDTKQPRYIKTVHKRGYRLIQEVQFEPVTQSPKRLDNSLLDCDKAGVQGNNPDGGKNARLKALLAIFIPLSVLSILGWNFAQLEAPTSTQPDKRLVKSLTRIPGLERSPLMSSNQDFIVYLREDLNTGHRSVWHKNLNNEQTFNLKGVTPYVSMLIALEKQNAKWQLMYLAQENEQCTVATIEIKGNHTTSQATPLFACTGIHIFDTAYAKIRQHLYYSAKRQHESKARVYRFDLKDQSHSLVLQPEVTGMGNRGIDLSPDEDKLLIVQVGNDYQSRLYLLDLNTNELSPGFATDQNIAQATWGYDSEHIMFFNHFPSRQIITSDLQGNNQQILIDMPDYVEAEFSRIGDSKDIIFSTINRDYNNRWIDHTGRTTSTTNSTVYDTRPALTHDSLDYAFISTRTGERQVYYGNLANDNHHILGRLNADRSLKTLSFSPDNHFLLTADNGHIWLINVQKQLENQTSIDLSVDSAAISTTGSLTNVVWLNNNYLFYKVNEKGQVKGYVLNRIYSEVVEVNSRWSDLLTDHESPNILYLVDKNDFQLYQIHMEQLMNAVAESSVTFSTKNLTASNHFLPDRYFDLKIHRKVLYFLTTFNKGNATRYDYQIVAKPLVSGSSNKNREIVETSCSCGFDVADSGFIVSELTAIEGDIIRTTSF